MSDINFINEDTLRKDDKAIKTFCLIDKDNLKTKMLEDYLEVTIVNVAIKERKDILKVIRIFGCGVSL